jgi:predicted GNAT family N-acyltransferase
VRGHGAGDILLAAGIARAESAVPGAVVWARARDSALGFYVRHGFEVVEPGFMDETTGRPHHVIVLRPR